MAWGRAGRQVVVRVTDGIDTLSRLDPSRLRGLSCAGTDVTVESLVLTGRFEGPDIGCRRR
jgi:hypothetical protein